MVEEIPCNLCGKGETDFVLEAVDHSTGRQRKFNVVRCRSCGLVYVNPRPTPEEIGRYYPEDSYYSYRYQDETTLKRRVRNLVLEEQGGYAHAGGDPLWMRLLGKLLATLARSQVLMFVPAVPNGKALDVGCGCGEHLLWLRQHGWSELHGVEISQNAAALANDHGLKVFCGVLPEARYPDDYFDYVSLIHVLEHTHDPMLTLREVHRVLKPDGLLVVGVPNFHSFENEVFGKHQSILQEVPRHLYHFSGETLIRMLEENGFDVKRSAGKTFFIPKVNRRSLKLVFDNESKARFIISLCRIYLERPLRYLFCQEKELFGQLFTFIASKAP